MDIPRRVRHDNLILPQNSEVEHSQVAVDPLSGELLPLSHHYRPLLARVQNVMDMLAIVFLLTLVQVLAVAVLLLEF